MNPAALALALFVVASGGNHGNVAALDPQVIASLEGATALVLIPGGSGSAFVVGSFGDRLLLVTNHHVLVPPRGMQLSGVNVILDAGTPHESARLAAEVLGTDPGADLAVLAVPSPSGHRPALGVARTCDDSSGAPIYVAGFPSGFELGGRFTAPVVNLSPGRISARQATPAVLELDVGINPGNSGGPVVTLDGTVVGVATAHVRRSERSFAVPCGAIQRLVARSAPGFALDLRDPPTRPTPRDAVRGTEQKAIRADDGRDHTYGIARLSGSGGRGTGFFAVRRRDELFFVTADTAMFRVTSGDDVAVWLRGERAPLRGRFEG